MPKDSKTAKGRISHLSDRAGMAIPVPHDGGTARKYNTRNGLPDNGSIPECPYKGVVTRSKPLPEPDDY